MTKNFHATNQNRPGQRMSHRRPTNPTSLLADQNAAAIATELLSHRKQEKTRTTIRFPKDKRDPHPSLVVVVTGKDCGSWYEHREGGFQDDSQCAGGHMIGFLMRFGNMSREDAHQWVRARFADQPVNLFRFHYAPTADELADAAKKKERFVRLLKETTTIKGTISEQYLKNERNITAEEFPTSLRHGHYNRRDDYDECALIGLASNSDGDLLCVHLVPLNDHGKKTGKTEFRTYRTGAAKGTAVILRKPDERGVMWIAEGLETALSIWSAHPKDGVIAVGSKENLKGAPIPSDTKFLIFAQDNDRDSEDGGKGSERTYDAAAAYYRSRGIQVAQVMPTTAGEDWNDAQRRGTLLDEISNTPWKGKYGTD
jgi:hypothetical protein